MLNKKNHNLLLFNDNSPDEAVSFIKEQIGNDVAFVGFSGGKDSIVLAELIKMSGVKYQLYYSFTGIDPPPVVKFIRKYYPECIFLRPKHTFWRDLSVKVVPSNRIRWCCEKLKKIPAWELPHKKRFMGIRAEESNKRAKLTRVNYFKKLDHAHLYPIFNWKEWEIWQFINDNGLKYPILYDWGFDRIGCIVCPFHSEPTGKMHEMYRKHWPKYFDKFEKSVAELYYKRVSQGKKMFYPTPMQFLNKWYLNNSARWYA